MTQVPSVHAGWDDLVTGPDGAPLTRACYEGRHAPRCPGIIGGALPEIVDGQALAPAPLRCSCPCHANRRGRGRPPGISRRASRRR